MLNNIKNDPTLQYKVPANLHEIVNKIETHTGYQAKQLGSGFSSRCPAHDDNNPSLSIGQGTDGTILLKCHAGCEFNEIVSAINIPMTELFPEKKPHQQPNLIKPKKIYYPYKDETGTLLYRKVRIEPGQNGKSKSFYFETYDKNTDKLTPGLTSRKILYHLPEVKTGIQLDRKIFIVEGEKDADNLLIKGLIATTPPTNGWNNVYTESLKNADVIILYDYDKTGLKRKEILCNYLFGKVRSLKVVDLPGLKYTDSHGEDVSDWFNKGGTVEQLKQIIDRTPDYNPLIATSEIVMVNYEKLLQLDIPKPEILLSPFLWSQGLVLLYAKRGVGKTHIALGIAYAVASGGKFLKWYADQPRKVLYIDGEMTAYSMQQRLKNIVDTNSDKKPLNDYLRIITPDLQKGSMPNLSTESGRRALEPFLEDCDLVIIDNLSSLFRSGIENEAESWMPIQEWSLALRKKGKTVLFVHHAGKNGLQRGTSKREDALDVVLNLKQPTEYQAKQGAHFEIHFEKTRHFAGTDAESFQVRLSKVDDKMYAWEIFDLNADPDVEKIATLRKEGKTYVEIMGKTNQSKSQIETKIKKAKELGLLQ